jgi:hypothetical protein
MQMTPADVLTAPIAFNEAWAALPFNIKLMLMHLWRAEQDVAGGYAIADVRHATARVEPPLPAAHRQVS